MQNIIGLGQCGCKIASLFQEPYNIILIDHEQYEHKTIFIPRPKNVEDYETMDLNLNQIKLSYDKTLFIVAGSGNIPFLSLRILEHVKKKSEIEVLYIQPDLDFADEQQKMKEKVIFNVFQEYARSGLFKMLWLCSNKQIDEIANGIPIESYYSSINDTIYTVVNNINDIKNSKPLLGAGGNIPEHCRIGTFGIVDIENESNKLFFELDAITDSLYYFTYNSEMLKTDKNLIKNIKSFLQSQIDKVNHFFVYETNYENAFVYSTHYSKTIQKDNSIT